MRDHNDQPVLGHLLQKLHDLNARFRIQRAGRLVGQQNVGVIDQRTRDGNALHLPAGHLSRPLVRLFAQPYLLQRGLRAPSALRAGHAGDRQRQLNVGQHRLVRNEIVALEYKADRVVAVGVPVAVGIFFGRNAVDDQIAAVVAIQAADDVQQRGLAGAAGPEDRHEFVIAQVETDLVQRRLHKVARSILFLDLVEL